ncbi:MAG: threonine ammonia-lyase [Bacillota bacterium]
MALRVNASGGLGEMSMVSIEDVRKAREVLAGKIIRTPLVSLSRSPGFELRGVYAKLESLQVTHAFKARGAYNTIANLVSQGKLGSAPGAAKGIVTFSSGNHAAGAAYAATRQGIRSLIVMPRFSIASKVEATKYYGGEVVIYGDNSVESAAKAAELERQDGYIFVHPFNDPHVIAGQGTIGLEILEDLPGVQAVVVPVSGGGLISGILVAIKESAPTVRVIGVQPTGAAAMYESLRRGRLHELDRVETVADGLTAKKVGDLTFSITGKYVDDLVLVSDSEISSAVVTLAHSNKILAEPSGAAAMAALLSGKVKNVPQNTVVLVSGGNFDPAYLARLMDRTGLAQ